MKRKTAVILLASAMMLTMVGCSGNATEFLSEKTEATETREETKTDEGTEDKAPDAEAEDGSEDAAKTSDSKSSASEDSFEFAGKTISMMDDPKNVIDILNSACTVDSKNSGKNAYCYDYDSENDEPTLSVYTYEKDGADRIGSIEVIKEEIKTSKGIGIGSTLEDLKAAYGEPYYSEKTIERYDYDFGDVVIQFYLKSGKVAYFSYFNADPDYYIR